MMTATGSYFRCNTCARRNCKKNVSDCEIYQRPVSKLGNIAEAIGDDKVKEVCRAYGLDPKKYI